jgi:outer membrane protein assembly factor BamB
MKTTDLIFIGIRGSVVALNRNTGVQEWATHLKGYSFVNVVVEDDRVIATCYGEAFCLEPLNGGKLWHNPLKGFGMGLATIATEHNPGGGFAPLLEEKRRRDQQTASSSTAATS